MRREPGVFAGSRVLLGGNHQLVRFPEIAVAMTALVTVRDALPQLLTCGVAAIPDDVSDDLASGATQRNPNPALTDFFQDK